MDDLKYSNLQKKQHLAWEQICTQCGACCGVDDMDPCIHLKKEFNDKYYCEIYEERFGKRKTQKGQIFQCVPIRKILKISWPGHWKCAYKQK